MLKFFHGILFRTSDFYFLIVAGCPHFMERQLDTNVVVLPSEHVKARRSHHRIRYNRTIQYILF
jgi:hypothetical protein